MPTDQPPRGDQEQPPPEKPPVRPRPPEAGSEEPPPQEDAAPDEERRPEPGNRESEWGFLATGAPFVDPQPQRTVSTRQQRRYRLTFTLVSVAFGIAAVPSSASVSVPLDGSFSTAIVKGTS
jgi:hypothetical protein